MLTIKLLLVAGVMTACGYAAPVARDTQGKLAAGVDM